ncbi:hypothetical protein BV22DRAFT_245386 [Leucogyrophana mollusca]|uniref:Uncharacterized protein n=1 Tax=Leucogyrophana mollusca TaxID=85980 RepID=A0ACB8BPL1_9AGAM|nr:hypothetical protein BV22DRAFT_245386 [Leucogyrophana mollusca]
MRSSIIARRFCTSRGLSSFLTIAFFKVLRARVSLCGAFRSSVLKRSWPSLSHSSWASFASASLQVFAHLRAMSHGAHDPISKTTGRVRHFSHTPLCSRCPKELGLSDVCCPSEYQILVHGNDVHRPSAVCHTTQPSPAGLLRWKVYTPQAEWLTMSGHLQILQDFAHDCPR